MLSWETAGGNSISWWAQKVRTNLNGAFGASGKS
jgi:hypothetical protein